MLSKAHKALIKATCLVCVLSPLTSLSAQSQSLSGAVNQSQLTGTRRFFAQHPKVKTATISSGMGTAAGAITGLISGKGVVRGAAIGAGTGAGVGLISTSELMKRHPIVRDTTMGTVSGAGIALSSTKRGKIKNMSKGAGVGAATGLAIGLLRTGLN